MDLQDGMVPGNHNYIVCATSHDSICRVISLNALMLFARVTILSNLIFVCFIEKYGVCGPHGNLQLFWLATGLIFLTCWVAPQCLRPTCHATAICPLCFQYSTLAPSMLLSSYLNPYPLTIETVSLACLGPSRIYLPTLVFIMVAADPTLANCTVGVLCLNYYIYLFVYLFSVHLCACARTFVEVKGQFWGIRSAT